jgi:TetR/AcrR family transcriptional regulator, mexJK operon transcriptional repressor
MVHAAYWTVKYYASMAPETTRGKNVRRSAPRKRAGRLASADVIMEAAATLFLRQGYLGTSMDEVAALARVSKQTVYTHFADKERLFAELVHRNVALVEEFLPEFAIALEQTEDVERDLTELACRYARFVVRPQVLQLRRLLIAEADRFPDLARMYYERVPERTIRTLASRFQHLADRGLLGMEDPTLAARHFAWLILGIPLDHAMFHGTGRDVPAADLDRIATAGVRAFLAAYATA